MYLWLLGPGFTKIDFDCSLTLSNSSVTKQVISGTNLPWILSKLIHVFNNCFPSGRIRQLQGHFSVKIQQCYNTKKLNYSRAEMLCCLNVAAFSASTNWLVRLTESFTGQIKMIDSPLVAAYFQQVTVVIKSLTPLITCSTTLLENHNLWAMFSCVLSFGATSQQVSVIVTMETWLLAQPGGRVMNVLSLK